MTPHTQITSDERYALSLLREDYSPAQVVGWFARFDILLISHETISRHIWTDKKAGGALEVHLRRANT